MFLVLHEAFYRGWFAKVDGQPARLLRANVLFRGVEVSEGRHKRGLPLRALLARHLRDAALGLMHALC